MLDNKELIFGKLEPGKSRTAVAPLGWCDYRGAPRRIYRPIPAKDAPRVCRSPRTRSRAPTE